MSKQQLITQLPPVEGIFEKFPEPEQPSGNLKTAFEPKDRFFLVQTSNFMNTIPIEAAMKMLAITLSRIKPEGEGQDFIVFDPNAEEEKTEDGGRSLRIPISGFVTCYAKLDDYGSVETLREETGDQTVNTRYVVTLMLAEDY